MSQITVEEAFEALTVLLEKIRQSSVSWRLTDR